MAAQASTMTGTSSTGDPQPQQHPQQHVGPGHDQPQLDETARPTQAGAPPPIVQTNGTYQQQQQSHHPLILGLARLGQPSRANLTVIEH